MKHKTIMLALVLAAPIPAMAIALPAVAQSEMSAEDKAYVAQIEKIAAEIQPQTGDIELSEAHATLHLADNYYFLGPDDARKVLVDAWGNPPSAADGVLGLVFPKGAKFYDPTVWGAVVTYEATGYVSDEDARTADYDKLLKDLQEGQEAANEERTKQGYAALHLVGWAQQPIYDAASHSVVWARNLHADGTDGNGLNYDVRMLGRSGVLSLNMLSDMTRLSGVNMAAKHLAQAASFDDGSRYQDYIPDVDKKAGYGIAGLVAAGAGVAAAKKLGFLAILLGFGKKFIVLLLAGVAALGGYVRRLLGGHAEDTDTE